MTPPGSGLAPRPLFDVYVVVDWSANGTPKTGRDSIWIGEVRRAGGRVVTRAPVNPPTRAEAHDLVRRSLAAHVAGRRRVLISFDFVYAFPRGFADALALAGPEPRWLRTWRALSAAVVDDEANRNNRWGVAAQLNRRLGLTAGPFWNCPRAAATADLGVTRGRFPYVTPDGAGLEEYRLVDRIVRRTMPSLQSVWKLYTPGSVGSQTLLGIPRLHALRNDPELAPWSRIWPFETGFMVNAPTTATPYVLHAEAWPRLVPEVRGPGMVRDARQVVALARHFAVLDGAGALAALFERPRNLSEADVRVCCDEEGWILGA